MLEDPVMKMYEAQAMLIERDQLLLEQKAELELARREIEKLRLANEQQKVHQAVLNIEYKFEGKLLEFRQDFEAKIIEELANKQQIVQKSIDAMQRILNAKCIEIEQLKIENTATTTKLAEISKQLENVPPGDVQYSSVMVLGGWQDQAIDSISIYNSNRKTWQNCGNLPLKLANHGAAILNGEIYFFGGRNASPNDPLKHSYKLRNNGNWIKLPDMNEKKDFISKMTVIFGSAIWVIGGWNGKDILATVEKFDPQTNCWTKMTPMNQARSNAAATVIAGKIYVSGGWDGINLLKTIEVFDPAVNQWEMFCEMPNEVSNHCSVVEGTNLIIIGGWDSTGKAADEVLQMDVLDPEKSWRRMPSLQQKRYNHGAVKLSDGIMVFGGAIDKTTRIMEVEVFNEEWMKGSRMTEQRGEIVFIPLTYKEEKNFIQKFCKN